MQTKKDKKVGALAGIVVSLVIFEPTMLITKIAAVGAGAVAGTLLSDPIENALNAGTKYVDERTKARREEFVEMLAEAFIKAQKINQAPSVS